MKKMLFVMNPCAGMRKANRLVPEILSVFNRADYQVQAYMTACTGDAAVQVEKLAGQVDLVVCAGGDGTFNETVTGLMRNGCPTPVGYIPCGSTNDFAASLHLPTDPVEAARQIVAGQPRPYDVGKFGDRYFSYVASFGAFTRTSYATPQNVKNALGHMAYILGGISELSQIRKEHISIDLGDRQIEDDFIFGAISNSTSVGGVLSLDPKQVDMQDGLFELLLVRAPKNLMEIHECIQALQKQSYNCAMMIFSSASQAVITADPGMAWTLDGERAEGSSEIRVNNLHHALYLMTGVA